MLMRTYWLSFIDPDKPEGERNLGVSVVEVSQADADEALHMCPDMYDKVEGPWVLAASMKAHILGCNPQGELAAWDLTGHGDPLWVAALPKNVLIPPSEAARLAAGPVTVH